MNFIRVAHAKRRKGFTLIEILTTVVIVGILAATSFVGWSKWREQSNDALVMNDLQNVGIAQSSYRHRRPVFANNLDSLEAVTQFSTSPKVQVMGIVGGATKWAAAATSPYSTSVCGAVGSQGSGATKMKCTDEPTITVAISNSNPGMGSTVTVDASAAITALASAAGLGSILNAQTTSSPIALVAWDFGDGTEPVGGDPAAYARMSHTIAATADNRTAIKVVVVQENGEVLLGRVIAGATGDANLAESQGGSVTSATANQPPVAVISISPELPAVSSNVIISGAGSSDPNNRIVTYAWTLDGVSAGNTKIINKTFSEEETGTHTVQLVITDEGGLSDTQTATFTVGGANQPPEAHITTTNQLTSVRALVSLSAAGAPASTDPEGQIAGYRWDFGDGSAQASGVTATHRYSTPGMYRVRLTVIDAQGATSEDEVSIAAVDNGIPGAVAKANGQLSTLTVTSGTAVTLDGSSSTAPNGTLTAYAWTIPGVDDPISAISTVHTFEIPGIYTVTLVVTDDLGGTAEDQVTIKVTNRTPIAGTISCTPDGALSSTTVVCSASGWYDPDGGILNYAWSMGSDWTGPTTGTSISGSWTSPGNRNITLTAKDGQAIGQVELGDEGIVNGALAYAVGNRPPVGGTLTCSPTTQPNRSPVSCVASGWTDPDRAGGVLTYSMSYDGVPQTGASTAYTFTSPGTKSIILTVTDPDLGSATTVQNVTVLPLPPAPPAISCTPTSLNSGATATCSITQEAVNSYGVVNYTWSAKGLVGSATGQTATYTRASKDTANITVTADDGQGGSAVSNGVLVTWNNRLPTYGTLTLSSSTVATGATVTVTGAAYSDPDGTISGYRVYLPRYVVVNSVGSSAFMTTGNTRYSDCCGGSPADFYYVANGSMGGGNSTATGTVVFNRPGTYQIGGGPVDNDGETPWQATGNAPTNFVTLTVTNRSPNAPTISCTPSTSQATNQIFTCTASGATDPDGGTVSYSWSTTGLGTVSNTANSTATYSVNIPGTVTVTAAATDGQGGTSANSSAVTLTFTNRAPIAPTVSCAPGLTVQAGQNITCTATGATDPDGGTISYTWSTTGRQSVSGSNSNVAVYSLAQPGGLSIATAAIDGQGGTSSSVATALRFSNNLPVQSGTAGCTPTSAPTNSSISCTDPWTDADGGVLRWWAGVYTTGGAAIVIAPQWFNSLPYSFTYNVPGTYEVWSTVDDQQDYEYMSSWRKIATITWTNRSPTAPTISCTPTGSQASGQTFTCSATSSTDPDGGTITYNWSTTGRTGAATGSSSTYSLSTPGTVSVTANATDGQGGTSANSSAVVLTFTNRAPSTPSIVCTPASNTGPTGSAITCAASGSTDPDGGTISYTWSATDRTGVSGAENQTASFFRATPGTTAVTVYSTDGQGGTSAVSATTTLTFSNRAPSTPGATCTPSSLFQPTGQSFSCTISTVSTDPDGGTVSYSWSTTGLVSQSGTGNTTAIYSMSVPANVSMVVSAIDGQGGSTASVTTTLVFGNRAPDYPTASFSSSGYTQANVTGTWYELQNSAYTTIGTTNVPSVTVPTGVPVTLNFSSSDPDGGTLVWNVVMTPPGGTQVTMGGVDNYIYTPTRPGIHTVSGYVRDDQGSTWRLLTATFTATNRPPSAPTISCTPLTVATASNITCTAGGSIDPDSGTVTYAWNGSGLVSSSGATAVYSLTVPGTTAVSANATDGQGGTSSVSNFVTLTFTNRPPTAGTVSCNPTNTPTGSVVTCTASGATDPDGGTITYNWSALGRTGGATGTSTTYSVNSPGDLAVSNTASDGQGGTSGVSNTVTITFGNRPPAYPTGDVTASGYTQASSAANWYELQNSVWTSIGATTAQSVTVPTGQLVAITANSSDPDGGSLTWALTMNPPSSAAVSLGAINVAGYTPTVPGTYTINADVWDDQGSAKRRITFSFIATNREPSTPTLSCLPTTMPTGTTATCTASGATDPDGGTVTYNWPSTGRTSMSGTGNSTATYMVNVPGVIGVSVTASDGQGGTSAVSNSVSLTFTNRPPTGATITCSPGLSVRAGNPITCTASGSTDPDGGTISYNWSTTSRTNLAGTGNSQATFFMATPGTANISVSASDGQGGTSVVVSGTLTFTNNGPTQSGTASCSPLSLNTSATITCTDPWTDSDGGTLRWWAGLYGVGGATAVVPADWFATATYTLTYNRPGSYEVWSTVDDQQGYDYMASWRKIADITYVNRAPNSPTVTCSPSTSQATGQTFNCSVSGSTDPDGGTVTYNWSSTGLVSAATGTTSSYSVNVPGTVTVTATASDGQGGTSPNSTGIVLTFTNRNPSAPSISCTPTTTPTGQTVTCSASGSTDPDNGTITYNWSATGRVGSATGASTTYSVNVPGPVTVQATATDGQGGTSATSNSSVITFTNRTPSPPTIACSPSTSQPTAQTFNCSASGAVDPDGGTITYNWSSTGLTSAATGATATYSVNTPGTITVTSTATDGQGGTSTTSNSITLVFTNRPPTKPSVACIPLSTLTLTVVTCTATGSTDPDNGTVVYNWSDTDRTGPATGSTTTYNRSTPGSTAVSAYATDGQGGSSAWADVETVTFANRPPTTPSIGCSPTSTPTASTITCTGSASTDPDGGTVVYNWSSSGRTGAATGTTTTYSVNTPSTINVSLYTTDGQGGTSASVNTDIVFTNRPPTTPTISCTPTSTPTGQSVTCTASGSTDPDGGTITYNWSATDRTGSATGTTTTYSRSTPGTTNVTANATDGQGGTSSNATDVVLTFTNRPPTTPTVSCTPTSTPTGQTVTCSASGATDPDGGVITYNWSATDRTGSATGTTTTYSRSTPGTTNVTANATDGQGGTSSNSSTATLTFTNRAPSTPTISCTPLSTPTGQTVTCTASGSTDPDGGVITYNWSATGRTGAATGTSTTYSVNVAGTVSVTANATDGQGGTSTDSNTEIITFTNRVPTAATISCSPLSTPTGQAVTCTASGSTDPDGGTVTYNWPATDRTGAATGPSSTYSRSTPGTTSVTVTTTDGQGGTSANSNTETITFTNRAPTAPVISCTPMTLVSGSTTTCTIGTVSTDPDGGTIAYNWSATDRTGAATGNSTTYSRSRGTTAVTATATDGQGGTSPNSNTVTVTFTNGTPTVPNVSCSPVSSPTGTAITCTVGGSTDPDSDPITYTWAGTGLQGTGASASGTINSSTGDGGTISWNIPANTLSAVPGDYLYVGRRNTSTLTQSYIKFNVNGLTGPGATITSMSIRLRWLSSGVCCTNFNVQFRSYNWGATLGTEDWEWGPGNARPVLGQINTTQWVGYSGVQYPVVTLSNVPVQADGYVYLMITPDVDLSTSTYDNGNYTSFYYQPSLNVSYISNVVTGTSATYVLNTPGTTTASATASDDQGATSASSTGVGLTFTNRAPTATTVTCTPTSLATGATTTCTASGATDPDGGTITYNWSATGRTGAATGTSSTYSINAPGTLTVSSYATDGQGGTGTTGSTDVTFTNQNPTVPTVTCTPTSTSTASTITCTGSASTDPDGGVITYNWSATDRTGSATGTTTTYSRATPGTTSVTAYATDGQGGTSTTSAATTITFTNRAPSVPTVSCTPMSTPTGQTVTCSASASTDPDGGTITYNWSSTGRTGAATGASTTYSVNTPSTVAVTAYATDGQGGTGTTSATVNVVFTNRAPSVPTITCAPTTLYKPTGGTIVCVGSGSTDPDGGVISYSWTPTGRVSTSGDSATYSLNTPGNIQVIVSSVDGQGGTTPAPFVTLSFGNRAPSFPTASVTASGYTAASASAAWWETQSGSYIAAGATTANTVTVPTGTSVTATAASTDPDGGVISWQTDMYNQANTLTSTVTTNTITFTPTVPGNWTLHMAVRDDQGSEWRKIVFAVVATNRVPTAPTISCTPSGSQATGQTFTCSASGSTDPDGGVITYNWPASGRTGAATGASTTYSVNIPSTVTVAATATDGQGGTSANSNSVSLVFTNRDPSVPTISCTPTSTPTGSNITCTGSASTDPDGGVITYNWSATDRNGAATGTTTTYSRATPGTTSVTAYATDGQGGTSATTSATIITFTNRDPSLTTVSCTPTSTPTGQTSTCTASGATDPDGGVITYNWSATGRTGAATGTTTTYSLSTPGTVTVNAYATDGQGGTGTTSSDVVVTFTNRDPSTPTISCTPLSTPTGSTVTCTSSVATDPDGGTITYSWSATDRTGATGGTTTTYSRTTPGTTVVTATAYDGQGGNSSASVAETLTFTNRNPTGTTISCTPTSASTASSITCTASGATDPDGGVITYNWSATDRTGSATGTTTTYSRATPGTTSVTAYATDGQGGTGATSATETLTFTNRPPSVPTISCTPMTTTTLSGITCTASASTDPDGGVVTYNWSATDRATGATGTTATYSRNTPGTTSVTAYATDDQGGTGVTSSATTLTFTNRNPTVPTVSCTPTTTPTGQTITCTASASTDPDGGVITYNWSSTDRTSGATGTTATYLRTTPGTTSVSAYATDGQGGTGSTSTAVIVTFSNRDPSLTTISCTPTTTQTASAITCTASGATDPDGGAVTYNWSNTDRTGAATGTTTTYSRSTPGTTSVTAYATDGQGGTGTTSSATVITFSNRSPSAPTISCTPTSLVSGATSTCTITGTSTDPDGGTITYNWSSVGRTGAATGTSTTYSSSRGTLTLTATASDGQGGTSSNSNTATLTFSNAAPTVPTVSCTPTSNPTGSAITCTASGGTDNDGDAISYIWSGSGLQGTGTAGSGTVGAEASSGGLLTYNLDTDAVSVSAGNHLYAGNNSTNLSYHSYMRFNVAGLAGPGATISSMSITLRWQTANICCVNFNVQIRSYNWGPTLDAGDWTGGGSVLGSINTTQWMGYTGVEYPTVTLSSVPVAADGYVYLMMDAPLSPGDYPPSNYVIFYSTPVLNVNYLTGVTGNSATYNLSTPGTTTASAQSWDGYAASASSTGVGLTFTNRAPSSPTISCSPTSTPTGATITCAGSGATDPDGGTITYNWSATGRTGAATGASTTYSVNSPSVVGVSAYATDGQGGTGSITSTNITFTNRAPSAPSISCTPTTTATGSDVTCTATGGVDPDGGVIGYTWSASGRTSGATGSTATYNSNVPGVVPVTAQATDGQGGTSSNSSAVALTFTNRAPSVPTISCTPTSATTGANVTCTGSASTDPDGGVITYNWSATGRNGAATGNSTTYTLSTPGSVSVTAYATDGQGGTSATSAATTINFTNRPPTAPSVSCTPTSTTTGQSVLCTASTSTDPDGGVVTYNWSTTDLVSEGGTGNNQASYSRNTPGTISVVSTASDGQGGTSTNSNTVVITYGNRSPSAPAVTCTPNPSPTASSVTCTGSGSTDPDGGTITYNWSATNRTGAATGNSTTYSQNVVGTLAVVAYATDGQGGTSLDGSTTITFSNRSPSAPGVTCTPTSLVTGSTTTCSISTPSTDPDGGTISYTWGATGRTGAATGTSTTYSINTPGAATITATALDGQGGSADGTTSVTFTNRDPSAPTVVCSPTSTNTGTTVTCNASGSVDPDNGTITYNWSATDRTGSASGASSTYSANTPGTTSVTAYATDGQGGTSAVSATSTITWLNRAPSQTTVSCTPTTTSTGSTITCTASGSTDPDGGTITYNWSSTGRTGAATGTTSTYSVSLPGTVDVTAYSTDGQGGTGATSAISTLTFANRAPSTPTISCTPTTTPTGQTVTCSASGSIDPDGGAITYNWSDTDRTGAATGNSTTYSRATPGTTSATVYATDGQGGTSATSSAVTLTFTNRDPSGTTISCTPTTLATLALTTCTASGSTDPDGGVITYNWSASNRVGAATGTTTTYSRSTPGTTSVTAYATDGQGGTGTTSSTVVVTFTNQNPTTPSISCTPTTTPTGQTVDCSISTASTDPDGGTITYNWSGTGRTGAATGSSTTYSVNVPGTVSVTANATDGQGGTSSNSSAVTLTFTNRLPSTPSISCTPTTTPGGTNVTCTASGSTDPDGGTITYVWSNTDRTGSATGTTTVYSRASSGTTAVTVYTTDGQGGTSGTSATTTLTFTNRAPNAPTVSCTPTTLATGATTTCTASATDNDGDAITSYNWSAAGRTGTSGTAGNTATYSVNSPGTLAVTATATDAPGATGPASNTVTVTFTNRPPSGGTVTCGASSAPTGTNISCTASGWTDPDGGSLLTYQYFYTSAYGTVAYSYGAGSSYTRSWAATTPGTYYVYTYADDQQGGWVTGGYYTLSFTNRSPNPPTISCTPTLAGNGATSTCTITSGSTDPDGGTVVYNWIAAGRTGPATGTSTTYSGSNTNLNIAAWTSDGQGGDSGWSNWITVNFGVPVATGGDITNYNGRYQHNFWYNGSYTFTIDRPAVVEVFMVGGGGAGSNGIGGGGAGGQYGYNSAYSLAAGSYTVYVGNGGAQSNYSGNGSSFGSWSVGGGISSGSLNGGWNASYSPGYWSYGNYNQYIAGGGAGALGAGGNGEIVSDYEAHGGPGGSGVGTYSRGWYEVYGGGGGGGMYTDIGYPQCYYGSRGGYGNNGGGNGGCGASPQEPTFYPTAATMTGAGGGGGANGSNGAAGGGGMVRITFPSS